MIEVVVFVLTALLAYFYWTRRQAFQRAQRLGIPTPKDKNLILGNLGQLRQYNSKTRMNAFSHWKKQLGPVFGFYFGPQLMVVVTELDMLKEILIKQFNCFVDRQHFVLENSDTPFHEGLINLRGNQWKSVRNRLMPTFSLSKMRLMSNLISQKVDIMMDKFDKLAETGDGFNIYNDFQALTLDVIGQCAFGITTKCQTDPTDEFLVHCQQFFSNTGLDKSKLLLFAVCFPSLGSWLARFRSSTGFGVHEEWLVKGLERIVAQRRAAKDYNSVDILQLMIDTGHGVSNDATEAGSKEPLSDKCIIGNSLTFLLAGYETTSTALAYTAWLLAKHKDVQTKLQNEIDLKLADNPPVSYDLVHKMPYLDAVFKESLRIYPPVISFVNRTCVQECTINGYKFEPGVQVMCPVYTIHHDPDIWPEPEKYDPERFMGDNNDYHPMAWQPFGNGPRNCIGMRFADMEYKMAIVRILSTYNIEFAANTQDPLECEQVGFFMRPQGGLTLKLQRRDKDRSI